jgi:hypothetical protein
MTFPQAPQAFPQNFVSSSYPETVGMCPAVIAGDSIRNSSRIEEFVHAASNIKHIIFLSNHALLQPGKKFNLHGNMFCFNYAGQPTLGIGYSPNFLRDWFFANLSKQPQTSHFKKKDFYEFISRFKHEFLAPESPLSLYGHGDEIHDMIVLAKGSIFEDEFYPHTPALKENPASAWLFSTETRTQPFKDLLTDPSIYNQFRALLETTGSVPIDYAPTYSTPRGRPELVYNPYGYRNTDGTIRAVLLSDIFNILKDKIRTKIVVSSSSIPSLTGDALENAVNEYMNRHVVLINTGCRCTGQPGDLLRRTVSSGHPHSLSFSRTKDSPETLGIQPFSGGRKRAIRITRKERRRKNGTNCKRKRRRPRSTRSRNRTLKTITHKTKSKK